jgi:hypothetical protein
MRSFHPEHLRNRAAARLQHVAGEGERVAGEAVAVLPPGEKGVPRGGQAVHGERQGPCPAGARLRGHQAPISQPRDGGVALALGFLTRLAAVGIIVIMLGAIARVHWPNGFDITKGGFEYNFAIIVMCLCLVLGGPGPLAVDRVFRFKRKES